MAIYRTTHDWDGRGALGGTVVEAVATATDADPTDMERLNDVVDPDALDRLFEPRSDRGRRDGRGRVEFSFEGHRVTVTAGGDVAVREPETVPAPDDMTDDAAFAAALERLVRAAEANGVDVSGGWACRDDSDRPDWGIEVYEVIDPPQVG